MSRVWRNLGEKGSGLRPRGKVQDFYKLRDECKSSGSLFEDPQFLPLDSSVFFSQTPRRSFEWMRPTEIVREPKLFMDGASRFDVQQGELGDCWLLAAVANITLNRSLFYLIVPNDQSFGDNYAGIFHFRFWQYGKWIDVVIDDKLPTLDGQLVFLHSHHHDEFWSALLEKAYAKLYGSYEALKGGSTCEAMEDFTGGVTEVFDMNDAPPNMFTILKKAHERSSLMACSIQPDPDVLESETPQGLITGHAYSVTWVATVKVNSPERDGTVNLIRIRNPWGNESEWNGDWSNKSKDWSTISEIEKQKLEIDFQSDGEFWMTYDDFERYFSLLEICNLGPDAGIDNVRKWEASVFDGEWVRGCSAGGCRNFLDTFWHNPQYRITVEVPDEDGTDEDRDKCTVLVALMQKNRRLHRRMGMDLLTIGFAVYSLTPPDKLPKPLDKSFFKSNASVARSPTFINTREVMARFQLPRGSYCIVPSTFEPNEDGEFILRVFSEMNLHGGEHDQEIGLPLDDDMEITPEPEYEQQEKKARKIFKKVAGDDMEVDWMKLKFILDQSFRKDTDPGFSKDLCQSIVSVQDWDRIGKLGYEEFKQLWADIARWHHVFRTYDKNNSKILSTFDLRKAFNSAGYKLNTRFLNNVVHRYGNKDSTITFDEFLTCAIRLKAMIEIFTDKDPQRTNMATFTIEEWIDKAIYS